MATLSSVCANCGKVGGGDDDALKLKKCNGCHLVKYCGFDCQKAHRPVHKTACKERAAEFYAEKLFANPPSERNVRFVFYPCRLKRMQFHTKLAVGTKFVLVV